MFMIDLAIRQYGVSLLNQWDEKDDTRFAKNSGFMLQVGVVTICTFVVVVGGFDLHVSTISLSFDPVGLVAC